jgi:hypothetical protein
MRLGIVEPVFGNIRETLGLRRFSLRGKEKVDGQWKLMTMLHNIFKIHRYGWEGKRPKKDPGMAKKGLFLDKAGRRMIQ